MATVGSSRNTRSGSPAIANANRTRCDSPPERVSTRRAGEAGRGRPARGSRRAARATDRAPARDRPARRPARRAAGSRTGASRRRGPTGPRPAGAAPSVRASPAVGSSRPSMIADGGRLAGAVRPEQGDGLAGGDREPDVVEREGLAEPARDAVEGDGAVAVGRSGGWGTLWSSWPQHRGGPPAVRSHARPHRAMTRVTAAARPDAGQPPRVSRRRSAPARTGVVVSSWS